MWVGYFIILLCGWCIVNGTLHDIFVLKAHSGPYNRDLLRLLMDGHVLLICGFIYLIAWFLFRQDHVATWYLCLLASLSLIVYCLMIFPFLKSFATLVLNLGMLAIAIIKVLGKV